MSTASVTNTFVNAATADADEVNTNFSDLVTFLNGSVVHVDGSKAFTGVVSGITPTADAHLTRKDYVDGAGKVVALQRQTTSFTVATSSVDTIVLNGTYISPDTNYFTTNLTTGTITVVKTGYYLVIGGIEWDSVVAQTERQIRLHNNGAAIAYASQDNVASTYTRQSLAQVVALTAADELTLAGYQASGGDLLARLGTASTYLRVVRLHGG